MTKEFVKTTTAVYSLNSIDVKEAIVNWLYDKHNFYMTYEKAELITYEDGSITIKHELKKEYSKD